MVQGAREFCHYDCREGFTKRGKPAPSPIAKQATTSDFHLAFFTTGSALTISTRMIAARIAEMTLETRPRKR